MKNLILKLNSYRLFLYCILMAGLLSSCYVVVEEKQIIVNEITSGTVYGYKYRYVISDNLVVYSNKVFQVGDTLKICH